ncbi:MAG: hypothetical protein ACRCSF_13015, partial [Mycobacteriaceae bacterium]
CLLDLGVTRSTCSEECRRSLIGMVHRADPDKLDALASDIRHQVMVLGRSKREVGIEYGLSDVGVRKYLSR